MLLFVGAWALDTYVDKDSPLAFVLLIAGVVSLLVFLASTDLRIELSGGGLPTSYGRI